MDKGVFVSRAEAESTTLKEPLERYLVEVTPLKKGAAPETNRLRAFMRHPLARRFVAGVRGVDMARFREERLQKVSSSTVKRDLVLLGHVFEVARKEWGIHVHNPVRDIKLPSDNRPRHRRLQAGEDARLLDACQAARNPWLLPIVQLALETAMRQGELIRLRREHIDMNRRTAHLPDTKNGEARTVPLSTTAVEVLRVLPRSLIGQVFPGVTTEAIKRLYPRGAPGRHRGSSVPRPAPRSHHPVVREGTEYHGSCQHHRPQGSAHAAPVYAFEGGGSGEEARINSSWQSMP